MTIEQAKQLLNTPLTSMTEEQKKLLPTAIKLVANSWGTAL
jgi:hypothetical protein